MTNRLQEIKERWPDNVMFEVNRKDMLWLIARVEELESAAKEVIRQHYNEDCNPDGINNLIKALEE